MGSRLLPLVSLALLCLVGTAVTRADGPPKSTSAPVPPTSPLLKLLAYPPKVVLDGPRGEQRLGVLGEYAGGGAQDLSRDATFTVENPRVASVDASGRVRGLADGETAVTIRAAS